VTTETSWGTVGSRAVTEQKQASVALDVFLSQFVRGWSYTFWYELRDGEGGDTAGMGLFHSDYSPKPAAVALRNLLTIFADNGGRPPLGLFSYSVQTSAPTVHNQMFQKSDGSFWLVVWNERATASDSVQITFGSQSRNYNLYDPTQCRTRLSRLAQSGARSGGDCEQAPGEGRGIAFRRQALFSRRTLPDAAEPALPRRGRAQGENLPWPARRLSILSFGRSCRISSRPIGRSGSR
jgi:hypothetical protein